MDSGSWLKNTFDPVYGKGICSKFQLNPDELEQ